MKTQIRLLALAVLAGGIMFAQTRFSVGIGIGGGGYNQGYYPPPAYQQQYVPVMPGPGYVWVDGYWAPQRGRNVWIAGFWQAPYISGYRMAPRYVGPRYYNSYRGYDRGYSKHGNGHYDYRGRGNSYGHRR
jgi:hypothetical protein